MLTRDDALAQIAASAARTYGAAVFIGNGFNPRALYAIADRPANFYMMGSMGLALPLAIGFSRRSRMATFAVEGDGNALMGLSAVPLATAACPPLVHVVLDNRSYESTGGQRSPAPGLRFAKLASAAGYSMAVEIGDEEHLAVALEEAISEKHVCLLHVTTTPNGNAKPPRISLHPAEITDRFLAAVAEVVSR